jgi:hypothetical protein
MKVFFAQSLLVSLPLAESFLALSNSVSNQNYLCSVIEMNSLALFFMPPTNPVAQIFLKTSWNCWFRLLEVGTVHRLSPNCRHHLRKILFLRFFRIYRPDQTPAL